MKFSLRALGKYFSMTPRYHIDCVYPGRIIGWAFSTETKHGPAAPLIVEAWHADACLGRTVANLPRPDVGKAYSDAGNSRDSGFDLEFRLPDIDAELAEIRIQACSPNDTGQAKLIGTTRVLTRRGFEKSSKPPQSMQFPNPAVPIPLDLFWLVQQLSPETDIRVTSTDDGLVSAILTMMQGPEASRLPAVVSYVRYMRSVSAHCQFVAHYFPNINETVVIDSKDASPRQNSAAEMLCIAHHLYVLRSFGLTGAFAEFGCFKGFSTSMLSYACQLLGIPMHVFDSFEGLPPSSSTYYQAGDFRGELQEVQRNVERFGSPGAVTYHKGFFSESLKSSGMPELISLWMDVDLPSSAQDVMSIANRIDARGAIFSHECAAEDFGDGKIAGHPDGVIPPILQAFAEQGAQVAGRFLIGNTGAFWRQDGGIPVLSAPAVMRLVSSI